MIGQTIGFVDAFARAQQRIRQFGVRDFELLAAAQVLDRHHAARRLVLAAHGDETDAGLVGGLLPFIQGWPFGVAGAAILCVDVDETRARMRKEIGFLDAIAPDLDVLVLEPDGAITRGGAPVQPVC